MSTGCWVFTDSVTKLTREVDRLGSTAARLKLKGIDGDPHKRWSMWFNSTVSEEPYQGLTCSCKRTETCDLRECYTGTARLSSARVVRCSLKWENERNPRSMLIFILDCRRLSWSKVGMTSNQRGLYALGHTRATMGRNKGTQHRKIEQILLKLPSVQIEGCNSPS